MNLDTYLNFNGNCREVFEFYRVVFGGAFTVMQTFRDGPSDMGVVEEELDQIMHVSLPVGTSVLMGSDIPSQFAQPPVIGNNILISISLDSKQEADRIFAELSEGGSVSLPMQDMFWGSYFGSFTDKYGINWQINYDEPQE